jgi:hypothetical protein
MSGQNEHDSRSKHDKECDAVRADLAELALGVLAGRERSLLLEHIATCERCSAELEQLSMVADTMLQLAPEMEPPLGFEQRLFQKLRAAETVRAPWRYRRASLVAAAAAVAVAAGVGIGTLVAPRPASGPSLSAIGGLTTASLTSDGRVLGEVFVSPGKPAWLFMTVDSDGTSGVVTCTVTLASGKVETVGAVRLSGGYGAWGGPLSASQGQIRSAQVVSADGTVLASAVL